MPSFSTARDIKMLVQSDDGWDDAAAESSDRTIRGTLLKFANATWSRGKEGTDIKEGTRLVALDTAAAWVKWFQSRPIAHKLRRAGHRLPDRNELGDLDEVDWEIGPDGKPKDPWQNTRFVYFSDAMSGEEFTFSTSTWGGRAAVSDLAEEIYRMRRDKPGALPVVELCAAPMLTRFGKKSKPLFRVIDWCTSASLSDQVNDTTPLSENKSSGHPTDFFTRRRRASGE
jgi:hypothetical protein